jgi:hypothetical protein
LNAQNDTLKIGKFLISKPADKTNTSWNELISQGSLKGIKVVKKQTEEFLSAHPDFPKLDREGHQARIEIEKNIIKELNSKFNYTDLFNQYVDVKYVKYI